jgi:hypothetical protein
VSKPTDLPRRLGDILSPALGKLAGSDEARAYAAWARAVGEPVTRGTRPKAFRRGQLIVECASSVWANELTYLGPEILRRMDEVAPGHPVRRFRFVIGRHDTPEPTEVEDSEHPASKKKRRDQYPSQSVTPAARAEADGVEDGRLREAIEAALRRSSEEPPPARGRGTPSS